jgi:hypothetical protein
MSPVHTEVKITTKNLEMIGILDWCCTTFDGMKKKKRVANCFTSGKGWRKISGSVIGEGEHTFQFDNVEDATLFALRWT